MISTIILIAAFQCYWIMRLYNDEKQNLAKETDVLFRDVVYKLQLQRFRNDTVFFKKGMPDNLFVFDVIYGLGVELVDPLQFFEDLVVSFEIQFLPFEFRKQPIKYFCAFNFECAHRSLRFAF